MIVQRTQNSVTGAFAAKATPAGADAPQVRAPHRSAAPGGAEPSGGGFDPRALTDFQLDELVHRIIGRVTRLIRTELRMDRERIGRLRDPRQ
ncbi:hypothetical protein ACH4OW_16605 [Streptomyces sp. NPDC017056]|uniref:hypothetical protein n=1 Tax=Streptomyces sp. NPDC017056 TaxID=3364973 RepID=UPI00379E0507